MFKQIVYYTDGTMRYNGKYYYNVDPSEVKIAEYNAQRLDVQIYFFIPSFTFNFFKKPCYNPFPILTPKFIPAI